MKEPSLENTFWFDAGRSYQLGVLTSIMKRKRCSLKEFKFYAHPILIRYLKDEEKIIELFNAYEEGYEKGEVYNREMPGKFMPEPSKVMRCQLRI